MADRETIAEGSFLGLYAENGWEFAARPRHGGVVGVLPVTSDGHVILVDFKIAASLWLAEERGLI